MGIVNVTPDSFSDSGRSLDTDVIKANDECGLAIAFIGDRIFRH
jgi:dihydropteroate synthase